MREQRPPVRVEHNGAMLSLPALARALGINYWTIYERYHTAGQRGADLIRPVEQPRPKRTQSAEQT